MLLQLQKYNLKFIYKKRTELYVADVFSHAYIEGEPDSVDDEQIDVLSLTSISPAHMAELQKHTPADPVMQKVYCFIVNGWPEKSKCVPPEVQPYFPIRDELMLTTESSLKA